MSMLPGYLVVTDHLPPYDENTDLSPMIQKIIDENPNRTIYFPDGVYPLASPICTSADPRRSVDLVLSRFAILRALPCWSDTEAVVRLGGKEPGNNIHICGSNYGLSGGVIDGNGLAKGISIDSGRETRVQDTSIKNTSVGLHIKHGANTNSSDADVINVHIVGTGAAGSIGVLIDGYDNSLTNMRVANVQIGFYIKSGGNFLRHLHPLCYIESEDVYANSVGFLETVDNNFYTNCYSDQFATAFHTLHGRLSTYDSCFTYWYSPVWGKHTAFRAEGKFRSVLTNFNVNFAYDEPENIVLSVGEPGGDGVLLNPIIHNHQTHKHDKGYLDYVSGRVLG